MTDNEYLEAILREQTLAPDSPELKALQEHREKVEKLIRKQFGSSAVIRYGGSKAKGTMIKEAYDLDLTCYFPHDDESAGATLKEIYENVESELQEEYATVRKPSVVRLVDAETSADFHVDVVPGRFVSGNDGDVFLHRTTGDKERLKTNLDVHIKHIRNSGVVDTIRLMKLWRERNHISLKTFGLDLLVVKLLKGKKGKPLSEQLTHIWEEMRDNPNGLTVEDPANPAGNDLSELLNSSVRTELASVAGKTLDQIDNEGWEAVFGEISTDEGERATALGRMAAASTAKPWSRE
jgi:Nucleotidyltransferase domain